MDVSYVTLNPAWPVLLPAPKEDRPLSRRPKALLAATSAVALAATTLAAAPAAYAEEDPKTTTVASGLDNPRQLSFGAGQTLYVAEAGTGGSGPCLTDPENPSEEVCLGPTGAITEVSRGEQKRIITGLPSLALAGGPNASGPADVAVRGNTITIAVGLGQNPKDREKLGAGGAQLGTLLTGRIGSPLTVASDLAGYEGSDPDGAGPDSNPTGFIALDSNNWAVIDAGGNDLIQVGKRGESTVAVFPNDRTTPAPFPGPWGEAGTLISFQSVPTDVVKGPDGAFYVSELTGFPFPEGASTIWKVMPGQEPTVYATGLNNVTSLDFKGNQLYAVQISDNWLLADPTSPPIGSVRKVVPGATDHPPVVKGLFAPYGIAIRGNDAYVTTGSVAAGAGEVITFSLR